MRSKILSIVALFILGACNSINYKPESLDKNKPVYTSRGGYTLRPAVKKLMKERGYNIKIGKIKNTNTIFETGSFESEISEMPVNAQYLLRVSESRETFRPIWCVFNGFWWWRFYVSIVDQHNGDEILTWTGRGCANSTLRKMDKILDKLEIKEKNE